jgi:hypothetical protein
MQQRPVTVGDTVTIVRRIPAPPGAVIEARPPADSGVATLIAPPVLTREGDSVRIAYTIAVWSAGRNDVVFPGAVVIDQRGHVDTLADAHVALDVASVLPAKSASAIAPHPARPWLVRGDLSLLPFVVLLPLALALVSALHWWWRRLGPVPVPAPSAPLNVTLTDARIAAWVAGGESRLALEHLDAMLRDRPECAGWCARAADVRFAHGNDGIVDELVREGSRLAAAPLAQPNMDRQPVQAAQWRVEGDP